MLFRNRNWTLLVLSIISCARKSPIYPVINNPVITKPMSERLFDSLRRFSHLNTFSLIDTNGWYNLEKFSLNQKEIAFICKDSSIQIFQKEKDQWKKTEDITNPEFYYSTYETDDYNGDGLSDLNLIGYAGTAGNKQATLFLSDTAGNLKYIPNCHLTNMRFNTNAKLVESFWEGGFNSTIGKQLHQWKGDSLVLVKGVSYYRSTVDGYSDLVFYGSVNGKKRIIKGVADRTEKTYDTALFTIRPWSY